MRSMIVTTSLLAFTTAFAEPVQLSYHLSETAECTTLPEQLHLLDAGEHIAVQTAGKVTVYDPYGKVLLSIPDEGLKWTYSGRFLLAVDIHSDDVAAMTAVVIDSQTGKRKAWELDFSPHLSEVAFEQLVVQGAPNSLSEIGFLFSEVHYDPEESPVEQWYFHVTGGDIEYTRNTERKMIARVSKGDGLVLTLANPDHYSIIRKNVSTDVPYPQGAIAGKGASVSPPYLYADNRWLILIAINGMIWIDELEYTDDGWKFISRESLRFSFPLRGLFSRGIEVLRSLPYGDGVALWLGVPTKLEGVYNSYDRDPEYVPSRVANPHLSHSATLSLAPHGSPELSTVNPSSVVFPERLLRKSMLIHFTPGRGPVVLDESRGGQGNTVKEPRSAETANLTRREKKARSRERMWRRFELTEMVNHTRGCYPLISSPVTQYGRLETLDGALSLTTSWVKEHIQRDFRLTDGAWSKEGTTKKKKDALTPLPTHSVGPGLWAMSSLYIWLNEQGLYEQELTLTFPEPPEDAPETVAEKE